MISVITKATMNNLLIMKTRVLIVIIYHKIYNYNYQNNNYMKKNKIKNNIKNQKQNKNKKVAI